MAPLMNMLISRRAGRGERASPVLFLHRSDARKGKKKGGKERDGEEEEEDEEERKLGKRVRRFRERRGGMRRRAEKAGGRECGTIRL